ncbi:3-deoxy-7-phosphoheptulonate synthase [Gracilaria domingensis]|nr:3-deoxy-7-phosphoheptulonate synthase [Gracilaria domingensis]
MRAAAAAAAARHHRAPPPPARPAAMHPAFLPCAPLRARRAPPPALRARARAAAAPRAALQSPPAWTPHTWRSRPILQQPVYPDAAVWKNTARSGRVLQGACAGGDGGWRRASRNDRRGERHRVPRRRRERDHGGATVRELREHVRPTAERGAGH